MTPPTPTSASAPILPSRRRSYSSASVNWKSGKAPDWAVDVGDEFGDDGVVEVHARRGGRQDDGLVELGWRHRAEHERSGADDRADPRILQRPIEEVGTDRGDPLERAARCAR